MVNITVTRHVSIIQLSYIYPLLNYNKLMATLLYLLPFPINNPNYTVLKQILDILFLNGQLWTENLQGALCHCYYAVDYDLA